MDPRDVARKALGMPVAAPMLTPEQEAALSAPVAPTVGASNGTIGALNGNFEPQPANNRAVPFAPAPRTGGGPSVNVDLSGVTEPRTGVVAQPSGLADMGPSRQGPPIIAPQYRAGGWMPGNETKQFEYGMAPEELQASQAKYESALGHAEKAASLELQASEAKAKNDAYYFATKQAEEQKYAQERAALLAAKQAKIDQSLADLDARSSAVANAKVNPEQFWEDKGGGLGRVMAAIAVGLGQYSASRVGGPNAALGIINSAIDRNIAAQRDNIENQKAGLQAKNSLYAQNLAAFGDKESALLATKMNYLEQAKAFADQQAALNEGSLRAGAANEKFQAATDNQIGDLRLKLAQLGHTREAFSTSRHYSPGGMVGGGAPAKMNPLWVPTGPNGEGYDARTEKEAVQARALNASYENMKNIVDEAAKIRKETGLHEYAGKAIGYDSENIAKLQSLSGQATFGMKNAEEAGALDKGVSDQAGKLVGDFASLTGNPEARARAYLEMIDKKRNSFRRANASLEKQQTIEQTPRGDYAESSVGLPKLNHPNKIIKTNKIGSK